MYSGIIGDNKLFRGELLAIIDVMLGRLNTMSLRSHIIAPVGVSLKECPAKETWILTSSQILLFSVVGMHHIQVLEAYFNGKELVVRTARLYDLGQANQELLILLLRWWLGHASNRSTQVE